jgi:hypothetical protein
MALPLVFKLPNSRFRLFPGIWKRSPGWSSTNSTTPISTGPQSAISRQKKQNAKSGCQRSRCVGKAREVGSFRATQWSLEMRMEVKELFESDTREIEQFVKHKKDRASSFSRCCLSAFLYTVHVKLCNWGSQRKKSPSDKTAPHGLHLSFKISRVQIF